MTRHDQIAAHYEKVWKTRGFACEFKKGPFADLRSDFTVLRFAPTSLRNMWTYATCCMSNPFDSPGIELHIFSDEPSEEVIEILFATAHFHRTEARLGLAHTVNFGRGWKNGSSCDHGLISLPYLDGPELENCETVPGQIVKCYWLVPIMEKELNLKMRQGVEALEQAFEREQFNYLDPARKSVVA